jgi:hypothetical protein
MFSAAARDERAARHFHAFGSRLIGVRQFLAPRAVSYALLVDVRYLVRDGRNDELPEALAVRGR